MGQNFPKTAIVQAKEAQYSALTYLVDNTELPERARANYGTITMYVHTRPCQKKALDAAAATTTGERGHCWTISKSSIIIEFKG